MACEAIIWTDSGILLIGRLGTKLSTFEFGASLQNWVHFVSASVRYVKAKEISRIASHNAQNIKIALCILFDRGCNNGLYDITLSWLDSRTILASNFE